MSKTTEPQSHLDKDTGNKTVETLESIFMGLPNGCVLKTPNAYNTMFTCTYKEHTRYSIKVTGKTPTEAVVKMAQALAFKQHLTKKEI